MNYCVGAAKHYPFLFTHPLHLDFSRQEKVEEDRYFRRVEHESYLKRKLVEEAHNDAEDKSAEEEAFKAKLDATIGELFGVLSNTGDKISDTGIENIAKWKLGGE